jgi:hypothetical protein
VVPSSEKSAVFCEIGRSCPSQNAQPVGAKLNGKIRILATNGSAMASSYVGFGKIPNSEMTKLTHRYCWKVVWGWLPPTGSIPAGFIGTNAKLTSYRTTPKTLGSSIALRIFPLLNCGSEKKMRSAFDEGEM